MDLDTQDEISHEQFLIIKNRYKRFIHSLNDESTKPISVFNPLTKKKLQDLYLIREVSKTLQMKKEEDIAKAKAAKLAEEEAAKKEAEQKGTEAKKEEEIPEGNNDEAPKGE